MTILYATYPWAFETPGGGEIQLLKYIEYGGADGIEIARHDPWASQLGRAADDGVKCVHFFSCVGGSLHFCRYVKAQNIPLIVSSSLWLTEETRHLYPVDEIRMQLDLADLVITNGDCESDQLAQVLSLQREKFATIRNGCDPRFASPRSPDLLYDKHKVDGPFVLNIGNIEPRKNQLTLIKAAKRADLPLVLVGHVRDQEYADKCRSIAGKQTYFLGPIPHQDPLLLTLLSACDLFCLPSMLETPGLAAIEAAAAGCPLIVTRHGSTREYFEDFADYVEPEDDVALAERLIACSGQKQSARTAALRAHVRQNFLWPKIMPSLKGVYDKFP